MTLEKIIIITIIFLFGQYLTKAQDDKTNVLEQVFETKMERFNKLE